MIRHFIFLQKQFNFCKLPLKGNETFFQNYYFWTLFWAESKTMNLSLLSGCRDWFLKALIGHVNEAKSSRLRWIVDEKLFKYLTSNWASTFKNDKVFKPTLQVLISQLFSNCWNCNFSSFFAKLWSSVCVVTKQTTLFSLLRKVPPRTNYLGVTCA